MIIYRQIKAKPKSGAEKITDTGIETKYTLLDFWKLSVSDILSNATRGRFAEFIVGTAVGINPLQLRDEWDAYDLLTETGIKIEVKSAAYLQSWHQRQLSKITFSIRTAKAWDGADGTSRGEMKRHADVYVLCHLKHLDSDTIDPLKMEQWDFYVLPTFKLDNYERSQKSITLNLLRRLAEPKNYAELRSEIEKAYLDQRSSLIL